MNFTKLKLGLPIVLAGVITFGLCGAFPQIPKNKLMVEASTSDKVKSNVQEQNVNQAALQSNIAESKKPDININEQKKSSTNEENKEVKIAAAAFENYLGLKIDRSEENVKVQYNESQGQQVCWVYFYSQPGAATGDIYDCMIDVKTEKVVQLRSGNNQNDIKSLSLEEAENITRDFLNRTKLISGKVITFKEKDMNDMIKNPELSRGAYQYAFCIYDQNNNYITINIDKSTKKVVGFFFSGIVPGLG